jgi:hypothetical protein
VTIQLRPGERTHVDVDLVNNGSAALQVRTFAADAYSLVNGGFGARLEGSEATGATRWLDYLAGALELRPSEPVTRSVAVSVPPNTAPGEYTAALVVQNADPIGVDGRAGMKQTVRAAMAVIVDVPGDRHPHLSIGGVDHAYSAGTSIVGFGVENDGDIRLRPTASFELRSATGQSLGQLDAPLDSIYAKTTTRVELPLTAALDPGTYRARLVLSDQPTGTAMVHRPSRRRLPGCRSCSWSPRCLRSGSWQSG